MRISHREGKTQKFKVRFHPICKIKTIRCRFIIRNESMNAVGTFFMDENLIGFEYFDIYGEMFMLSMFLMNLLACVTFYFWFQE